MYRLGSYCKFSLPNLFLSQFKVKNAPKWLIKENTKAFVNVIKNNPVDIITHLNFCCYADAVEVAKVAADYGTYIELNAKKIHLTKDELCEVEKTGVNFVISSDAHTPDRVGEISLVEDLLKEVHIDSNRIMNIDGKLPDFRFRAYKDRY
jgi:putative hydrolase